MCQLPHTVVARCSCAWLLRDSEFVDAATCGSVALGPAARGAIREREEWQLLAENVLSLDMVCPGMLFVLATPVVPR